MNGPDRVEAVPVGTTHLRGRLIAFTLGGPLANVVVGFWGLGVWLGLDVPPVDLRLPGLGVPSPAGPDQHASPLLFSVGLSSSAMGLGNLIPLRHGSAGSEGARVTALHQDAADELNWYPAAVCLALRHSAEHPRQWQVAAIERAIALAAMSETYAETRLMAYIARLGRGDAEAAGRYLAELADRLRDTPLGAEAAVLLRERRYAEARERAMAACASFTGGDAPTGIELLASESLDAIITEAEAGLHRAQQPRGPHLSLEVFAAGITSDGGTEAGDERAPMDALAGRVRRCR